MMFAEDRMLFWLFFQHARAIIVVTNDTFLQVFWSINALKRQTNSSLKFVSIVSVSGTTILPYALRAPKNGTNLGTEQTRLLLFRPAFYNVQLLMPCC